MKFSLSEKYQDNAILRETFGFSVEIVKYTEELEKKRKFVISRQLLKSATSIGANVKEAQNAESKLDFIHKMKIASKEADETEYWLFLCQNINTYPNCEKLIFRLDGIMRLLNKIIGTSKRNSK